MKTVYALAALGIAAGPLAAQESSLSRLSWLVGCWERTMTNNRRGIEVWEAPRAGVMSGGAWIVSATGRRETEQLRLWASGDTLVYEGHPSTQERTRFRSTSGSTEITFADPEHDYPQRIIYRKVGSDSVIARTEGDKAGRLPPENFPYKRVACDPALTTLVNARGTLYAMYDTLSKRSVDSPGARMEWLVDHSAGGFSFVVWVSPGSSVVSFDSTTVRRMAAQRTQAFRNIKPFDSKASFAVEKVVTRGDSLDVLVLSSSSYKTVDDSGRYGPRGGTLERGTESRIIDRWVIFDGQLKILKTEILSESSSLNGRVITRDGKRIPATP